MSMIPSCSVYTVYLHRLKGMKKVERRQKGTQRQMIHKKHVSALRLPSLPRTPPLPSKSLVRLCVAQALMSRLVDSSWVRRNSVEHLRGIGFSLFLLYLYLLPSI